MEGVRFFILWMAGVIFAQLAGATVNIIWSRGGPPGADIIVHSSYVIAVAKAAWCAWLIFQWNRRTLIWTAPAVFSPIATSIGSGEWEPYIFVSILFVPIVQYLTLCDFRRRPSFWFVVVLADLVVSASGSALLKKWIPNDLEGKLSATLPTWIPLSVDSSLSSGVAILGSAIGGAALAWVMKPSAHSLYSPPARD